MNLAAGIDFVQRGWVSANMVVLRGAGETVVIDPGHHSHVEQTIALWSGLGVSAETISKIIITHSHWDHSSSLHALRQQIDFQLGTGALTDHWFRTGALREMWLSYFGVENLVAMVSADFIVDPESTIELAGRSWQTLSLPGHAPDTVGFFQVDTGILISADSLMLAGDCGLINTVVHGDESIEQALVALDRIEACAPRVVLPGHGPAVTDVPSALGKLRKRLHSFAADRMKHVTHLARRVCMAAALELPPLSEPALVASISKTQWASDYAALLNQSPQELVGRTVLELQFGGALRADDGLLVCTVPR